MTPKPLEKLNVGDIVMWTGKVTEYSPFQRRLIYQVVQVIPAAATDIHQEPKYRLRPAYDIENPVGAVVEAASFTISSNHLKNLSLLDMGIIRLTFDNFIKEWAKSKGANITSMPTERDVTVNDDDET